MEILVSVYSQSYGTIQKVQKTLTSYVCFEIIKIPLKFIVNSENSHTT